VSVEQTDVVDIVSTDRWTGHVTLTISDHLDWTDSIAHQTILQRKLNAYLAFVESGEILEKYPKAKDKPVAFAVVFKFPPMKRARLCRESKAGDRVAGFSLTDRVYAGAGFN